MKNTRLKINGLFLILTFLSFLVVIYGSVSVQAQPFAYVPNSGSNNVSVIDTSTNTVTATISVGNYPYGVAVSPDGKFVYVTNNLDNTVSVIDTSTNTVTATVSVGSYAWGVDVSPDGKFVYVTNFSDFTVSVIDASTNTVTATVSVGVYPFGVDASPDGKFVYVTNFYYSNTVSVIDASTNTVTTTVSVGSYAWGVDVSPDGKFVYVVNGGSNNVSVIDTSTNTVTATVPVGFFPYGVAVSPDGKFVYVTNNLDNTVSLIDTSTNTVTATVPVGVYPFGVAVSPDGKFVYVTNSADGTVSVIDTSTNTVTATVSVGLGPFAFGKFIGPAPKGTAPIANAGSDQTVNEGNLVSLDGSGSRSLDGGTLTYHWSQVAGPAVTLNLTDPVHPTFVAPHVPLGGATLTFELIVTEGDMTSDPAVVNIVVKHVNHPPVADAGSDQTVQEGSPVTLDGSNSYDPDSDTITYSWAQTAGPSITLSDPTAVQPSFTSPIVGTAGATLTFALTVSDGTASSTANVNIIVQNINHAPTAVAGNNQTINEGNPVTLDGTASSDPDSDPLTFTWTQLSGPAVTLSDPHSSTPTFTAPQVNHGGETLVFQLVVNDGLTDSTPNDVTITVLDVDDPPACDLAQPSLATLWPPNHKLVSVGIVGVSDPTDDTVTVTITGVTQDEPVKGTGAGDTSPDAVIQDSQVLLRVERSGNGNGRVYQINFTADDSYGGRCTGSVLVCVPHDRETNTCINDGQGYNSLTK